MSKPVLNIQQDFVVLDADKQATPVEFNPQLFADLDTNFNGFKGCELIASFNFDADWPTWEMHPNGDEVVMLLSGEAELVLQLNGADQSHTLRATGDYMLIPKGVWHTAKISQPTNMLFITPGEGTQQKSV